MNKIVLLFVQALWEGHPDLKEMKSSWLANVTTRLLSSLGTGNRYLRIFDTCASASH